MAMITSYTDARTSGRPSEDIGKITPGCTFALPQPQTPHPQLGVVWVVPGRCEPSPSTGSSNSREKGWFPNKEISDAILGTGMASKQRDLIIEHWGTSGFSELGRIPQPGLCRCGDSNSGDSCSRILNERTGGTGAEKQIHGCEKVLNYVQLHVLGARYMEVSELTVFDPAG